MIRYKNFNLEDTGKIKVANPMWISDLMKIGLRRERLAYQCQKTSEIIGNLHQNWPFFVNFEEFCFRFSIIFVYIIYFWPF